MKFSDRIGITRQKNVIQRNGIDDALRNKLWNIFYSYIILPLQNDQSELLVNTGHYSFFVNLYHNFFEKTIDSIPELKTDAITGVRSFFFECNWHDVYNIIEFVNLNNNLFDAGKFRDSINMVLEVELSAYRFVGEEIILVEKEESKGVAENSQKLENSGTSYNYGSDENISLKESKKIISTDDLISAIEPSLLFDELKEKELKDQSSAEIIESTKAVKEKLGLRSDDRDAFLTIKSKPVRTSYEAKLEKDDNRLKGNSLPSANENPGHATHREKSPKSSADDSAEKKDELDKAISILRQKDDAKIKV